jgi:hypothetical protein
VKDLKDQRIGVDDVQQAGHVRRGFSYDRADRKDRPDRQIRIAGPGETA